MDVVKLGGDSLASRQREKGVRGGREREIARENDSSAREKN